MSMANILNTIFSPTLGIFFHLTDNYQFNVMFGVFWSAFIISLIILLITKKMIDQDKMKELKQKMEEYNKKLREARMKNDMKKVEKITAELFPIQREMMAMSLRPLMFTFLPIILIFNWLKYYEYLNLFIANNGYLVTLPFILPVVGNKLGWFGWYILCSLPVSSALKIMLKIETP